MGDDCLCEKQTMNGEKKCTRFTSLIKNGQTAE
jgi:hypothetical protein